MAHVKMIPEHIPVGPCLRSPRRSTPSRTPRCLAIGLRRLTGFMGYTFKVIS